MDMVTIDYCIIVICYLLMTLGNIYDIGKDEQKKENAARVRRKGIYRLFFCYEKQEPRTTLKKVVVLQSLWYGLVLLFGASLCICPSLDMTNALIVFAPVFVAVVVLGIYTGQTKPKRQRPNRRK